MGDKFNLMVVDDEIEILNAIKRALRKSFDVHCFSDPREALLAFKETNFAIVISDMRMPDMDGAEFLTHAKDISPDTVRILLTGFADLESMVKAINEGQIFSYISKPWNNEVLKTVLTGAVERYQLTMENARLTEELIESSAQLQELNQSLEEKVKERTQALRVSNQRLKSAAEKQRNLYQNLIDMLNLIIEERAGDSGISSKILAKHAKLLAASMNLERAECNRIYLAGLFQEIGKIGLPDDLISCPELTLKGSKKALYLSHVLDAEKIIGKLPSLKEVGEIIASVYEDFNGMGFPEHLEGDNIPVGSRILRVVNDYHKLMDGKKLPKKLTPNDAKAYLRQYSQTLYDGDIVEHYLQALDSLNLDAANDLEYVTSTDKLKPGTMLARDIAMTNGGVLLTKDTELSENHIQKLKNYEREHDHQLTIFVF